MKSKTKILAIVLAAIVLIGAISAFAIISHKQNSAPDAMFLNAFDMWRDEFNNNAIVKLFTDAAKGGSFAVKVESGEGEQKTAIDFTAYINAAGNAGSAAFNADVAGQKINAQFLLNQQKVVFGTSLLKDAYGLDIEKAKDNFPTSLFGTKGENMLGISEEDEAELLNALDAMKDAFKRDNKKIDFYEVVMNALKENATFAADTNTPVTIDGQEVKNTTITVTLTKDNLKSMMNEIITKGELQTAIEGLLQDIDEEANAYESMNSLIDTMFAGKDGDSVVLTVKAMLDTKHNAIMVLELTTDETVRVEFGADPTNITKIALYIPTEEMSAVGDATITKTEKITITINESTTSTSYEMLSEDGEGISLTINKAHKELVLSEIVDGQVQTDTAFVLKYELTDNLFSLSIANEGDEYSDATTITVTVTGKVTSPVKYDNYKDLLTMTEDDFINLMQELEPLMGGLGPVDPMDPSLDTMPDIV